MKEEFTFNGQHENEKVIMIVKNHPFVLFFPGVKAVFFLIMGIASVLFISNPATGLILLICVLIAIGIFVRRYYDFNQSVFIITDQRVISVEQDGFWKRKIIETERNKIQDITSDTKGFFRIMIKYGNLIIHTAGSSENSQIIVKNIPNPYEIQQKIAK